MYQLWQIIVFAWAYDNKNVTKVNVLPAFVSLRTKNVRICAASIATTKALP